MRTLVHIRQFRKGSWNVCTRRGFLRIEQPVSASSLRFLHAEDLATTAAAAADTAMSPDRCCYCAAWLSIMMIQLDSHRYWHIRNTAVSDSSFASYVKKRTAHSDRPDTPILGVGIGGKRHCLRSYLQRPTAKDVWPALVAARCRPFSGTSKTFLAQPVQLHMSLWPS